MTWTQFAIARECHRLAEMAVSGQEVDSAGFLVLYGAVTRAGQSGCPTELMDAVAERCRAATSEPLGSDADTCGFCGHGRRHHPLGYCSRRCPCAAFVAVG